MAVLLFCFCWYFSNSLPGRALRGRRKEGALGIVTNCPQVLLCFRCHFLWAPLPSAGHMYRVL